MAKRNKPLFYRVQAPRNVRPVVKILKVGANDFFRFICLSPIVWGVATHWTSKRRTQPCIAHRGQCQHCVEMCPRRDRGYVLTADKFGVIQGFLDMTPDAFQRMLEIRDSIGTLRGHWFQAYRRPTSQRGALFVELMAERWEVPENLPADIDPGDSLKRVWGLDNVG